MEKTSFVHSFFRLLSSSALSNCVLGIEKTKVTGTLSLSQLLKQQGRQEHQELVEYK